jgi:uncharacterized protein
MMRDPFVLGGVAVRPGESAVVDVPISSLANRLPMNLPVKVIHGVEDGPTFFVSAAVHGDEIIGVEIIRRLSRRPALSGLSGTLLLIPLVNGYGFLNRSRYLPDRRDLNRCFPGSESGSLADRLAHVFLNEIVARCDLGLDIHSAAINRSNLPQIRIAPDQPRLAELAKVFGAPAILHSSVRDGSLRKSAAERGVPVLLFEGGEGLRFDETAIRAGVAGALRVMHFIGMIGETPATAIEAAPVFSRRSTWMRAPEGGLLRLYFGLGDAVAKGQRIGTVSDLLGEREFDVISAHAGLIVGRTELPVVNEGDAIVHIAHVEGSEPDAETAVDAIVEQLGAADMFYEDEII